MCPDSVHICLRSALAGDQIPNELCCGFIQIKFNRHSVLVVSGSKAINPPRVQIIARLTSTE